MSSTLNRSTGRSTGRSTNPGTDPSADSVRECNCLALRQAARHVTAFYDRALGASGLRTTQFSILGKLLRHGPMTINALAATLVMDRTTLGRNLLPLERERLVSIARGSTDRRSKEICVTQRGRTRFAVADRAWALAQAHFEATFGRARSATLRRLLRAVAASELSRGDGESHDDP